MGIGSRLLVCFGLAVLIVTASCKKNEDGGGYDFNGLWLYNETITPIPPSCIIGWSVDLPIRIVQDGNTVSLNFQDDNTIDAIGTCDSQAGTIAWEAWRNSESFGRSKGVAMDEETLQGTGTDQWDTLRSQGRVCTSESVWTMKLVSR